MKSKYMLRIPIVHSYLRTAIFALLLGGPLICGGSIRINEFLAANDSVNADADGDFEDWIELHNTSATAVNLDGYGLTDDPAEPFRWRFGEVVVQPGEFLLVWASGKDRRDGGGAIHTNFSISADGEPLQLTRPDGTVEDLTPATRLPRNVSMGCQPDGGNFVYFFDTPTPGASNTTTAFTGIVDPPVFSHPTGFYTGPFELEISHADPGVEVLYTLDSSEPGTEALDGRAYLYKDSYAMSPTDPFGQTGERQIRSQVYSAPLTIADRSAEPNQVANLRSTFEQTPGTYGTWPDYIPDHPLYKGTIVRAKAVKPGAIPSEVVTRDYFFMDGFQLPYSLPVVSLVVSEPDFYDYQSGIYVPGEDFDNWRANNRGANAGPGAPGNYVNRGREWERPLHVTLFDASGAPVISQDAGVRAHGGYARLLPRKFLRLYARSDYGEDSFKYPFFDDFPDLSESWRVLLRFGDVVDNYLADFTASILMQPTRVGAQKAQPVIQFINGEYWGVSFLLERIDQYFISANYGVDPDNVLMINAPNGRSSSASVEEGGPETLDLYRQLYDYIIASDMRQPGAYRWVQDHLDIDSYLDYYNMFIFLNNGDWGGGTKHFRFWRVREPDGTRFGDGRWRLVVWDFDGAARDDGPTAKRNDARDMIDRAINTNTNRAMLNNLLLNPEFRARFVNRLADLMNTSFVPERIIDLAEYQEQRIAPEMAEHFDRWGHPSEIGKGTDSADRWIEFASRRHGHVRDHLRAHFQAGSDASVVLDVSDPEGGYLTINTVDISSDTAGVDAIPYPWSGTYFTNVPVTVTAHPSQDYRFIGWQELPGETSATVSFQPTDAMHLTALFQPIEGRELVYYWDFNNLVALTEATYARSGNPAISFQPAAATEFTVDEGEGFAGENARLESLPAWHLRVNNPLGASLLIELPTTGIRYPLFQYETRRSNNGAGIQNISYSLDGNVFHHLQSVTVLPEDPVVVRVDLADITGAADNPNFALGIDFAQGDGDDSGNNRFDNITLEGIPASLFSDPAHQQLAGGWKSGPFGTFNETFFPYVYHWGLGSWFYVMGTSESSFHFWIYSTHSWAWSSGAIYPCTFVFDETGGGNWHWMPVF